MMGSGGRELCSSVDAIYFGERLLGCRQTSGGNDNLGAGAGQCTGGLEPDP